MAVKIREEVIKHRIVTDDVDDTELPADTKPMKFMHRKNTYKIYLSDANAKELNDALDVVAKFAGHGDKQAETPAAPSTGEETAPVRQTRRDKGAKSAYSSLSPADRSALREWGQANGKVTGDRGRVPDSVVTEWQASRK